MPRIRDRVVVVTGGSSGLGRATEDTARQCHDRGAVALAFETDVARRAQGLLGWRRLVRWT